MLGSLTVKKRGCGGQGVVSGCWACLALAATKILRAWRALALSCRCVGCNSGTPVGAGAGEGGRLWNQGRNLETWEPGKACVGVWVGVGGGTREKRGPRAAAEKTRTARGQANL